jgi:hypothetical protein
MVPEKKDFVRIPPTFETVESVYFHGLGRQQSRFPMQNPSKKH